MTVILRYFTEFDTSAANYVTVIEVIFILSATMYPKESSF